MAKKSLIQVLSKILGTDLVGAEIGVYKGSTSFALLRSGIIKHLYMIDPWHSGYSMKRNRKTDSSDRNQEWMDANYQRIAEAAKEYPATVLRLPSLDAAKKVPNELDFVFIDGNHSTKFVFNDLCSWVPKVKINGIVAGDDWSTGWRTVIAGVAKYIETFDPFLPPFEETIVPGRPVPYGKPIINRTTETVWWGVKKPTCE